MIEFRYELQTAFDAGESSHPQAVVRRLAQRYGFQVVKATPHPIGDCWLFTFDKMPAGVVLPTFLVPV